MRIIELTREAVEPIKPLQILPQGNQTPPPLTDKDVAPNKSSLSGKRPELQVPAANPAPAPAAATAKPAAAATAKPAANNTGTNSLTTSPNIWQGAADPKDFGGALVNPPSKSGVVSKADLEDYRLKSGNPTATLGQYMNQQKGLTARKGGANDPAVIAARQQPVGPPVGSQAQTASGKNELAKFDIAKNKPPAPTAQAASGQSQDEIARLQQLGGMNAQVANPFAPNPQTSAPLNVVSRNDGNPPPLPAEPAPAAPDQRPGGIAFNQDAGTTSGPAAAPAASTLRGNFSTVGPSNTNQAQGLAGKDQNSGSSYTGGVGNVQDFGVRGTPILPYGQGSPVKGTTNAVTRTDAEIGDKGVPGSFDKNRAAGDANLAAVKNIGSKISNFLGGNKQTTAASPVTSNTATTTPVKAQTALQSAPLRGEFKESTGMQDPVLVRMQNLAGIRR